MHGHYNSRLLFYRPSTRHIMIDVMNRIVLLLRLLRTISSSRDHPYLTDVDLLIRAVRYRAPDSLTQV
jgi:hypothetical protein